MQTAADTTTSLALEHPGYRLPKSTVDDVIQNEVRRELNGLREVRNDDSPSVRLGSPAFDVSHELQKHRRNNQDQETYNDRKQSQGQTHRRTLIRRHRPRSGVSSRVTSAFLRRLRFSTDFADEKRVAEENDGQRHERTEGEPDRVMNVPVYSLTLVIRCRDVIVTGANQSINQLL